MPSDSKINRSWLGVVPVGGEALCPPAINRRGPSAAHIAARDARMPAQVVQRPNKVVNREQTALPICDNLILRQTVQINRDIGGLASKRFSPTRKTTTPVFSAHAIEASLRRRLLALGPSVHVESAGLQRPVIGEQTRRPRQLEVAASPDANTFDPLQFQRTIHPTAATPARWADVPVGMIVEADHCDRLPYPPQLESCKIMKITGTVENEVGQLRVKSVKKALHGSCRRAVAQTRSPIARINRRHRQISGRPGGIEVEMDTGGHRVSPL